jgi:uncharacterized alpha-E superfamily protein
MSRYVERAENTGRIVDVNLQLLLDIRDLNENRLVEYWLPIVQATGDEQAFFKLYPQATGKTVTEFLVFQAENPNSLVSSICQARENARMVRDQISVEFWEELNRLYWFVKTPDARRVWKESPSDFFQQIKNSSMQLIGLGYSTLIRNEGWWFSEAGKFIERADKTSRMLDLRHQTLTAKTASAVVSPIEAIDWSAILRSCSAWDAYKAHYGVEVNPRQVVEFLLFNEDFPRSVRFSVGKLNDAMRRISGCAEGRFCNTAEKLAGRLLAELQFSTVDEIFDQSLHLYLDQLQTKLNNIGEALFDAYIFQAFENPNTEHMVQQEEQQQQSGERRAPSRLVDGDSASRRDGVRCSGFCSRPVL